MNRSPVDPLRALQVPDSVQPTPRVQGTASGNPAFRVLFEQLQAKAEALEERSKDVADPGQLSGAVDAARSSLQDALSLGERLLEAFREVRTQSPHEAPTSEENQA